MLQPEAPSPPPPVRSASNAVVKHNPKFAKVNMMNAAQAKDSSEVIMGNFPIISIPAKVLFDTSALHCFMSRSFVSKHDFISEMLGKTRGSCFSGLCYEGYHDDSECFHQDGRL